MKKKIAVLLIAASLLSSFSQTVYAYEEPAEPSEPIQMEISPRYTNISSLSTTLTRSGKITFRIQTIVRNYSATITLQQKIDGSWEDIDSWSDSGYLDGYFSTTVSLESGETYRVRSYVEIYDDNGNVIETTTKYSATV